MITINVISILSSNSLLTAEKGKELLSAIEKGLNSSSSIIIDFSGFSFLSSSFLNNSFGQLALDRNWEFDTLKKHIQFNGIDEDDLEEIELAVFNALSRRNLINKGIDPQAFYSAHLAY